MVCVFEEIQNYSVRNLCLIENASKEALLAFVVVQYGCGDHSDSCYSVTRTTRLMRGVIKIQRNSRKV